MKYFWKCLGILNQFDSNKASAYFTQLFVTIAPPKQYKYRFATLMAITLKMVTMYKFGFFNAWKWSNAMNIYWGNLSNMCFTISVWNMLVDIKITPPSIWTNSMPLNVSAMVLKMLLPRKGLEKKLINCYRMLIIFCIRNSAYSFTEV